MHLKSNLSKLPQTVKKIFEDQGGWRNQRLEYTQKRIRTRIQANLEALDRIYKFIKKSKDTDPGWEDAMQEVERLKEDITTEDNTPRGEDQT